MPPSREFSHGTDTAQWFVSLRVFCVIQLYMCVCVQSTELSLSHIPHMQYWSEVARAKSNKGSIVQVQWWGTLPNKLFLCAIVQSGQLIVCKLAVGWLCFTSELPWKNMILQRAEWHVLTLFF